MKSKVISIFLFISILLFGSYFRLTNLNSYPPSLFSDEVDAGYQSAVFNHYGTDYFGNRLPTHFHSFSDWRTPLYIYSVALAQKITNNQNLSVRWPSAIFGIISLVLFYFMIKNASGRRSVGLIGMALLALSPWHVHYSRIGFEVSGMIMVLLLGIIFFQQFIQSQKQIYLFLSVFSFLLSPYFYSTAKLFLLLVGLIVLALWHRLIFKLTIPSLLGLAIFAAIVSIPLISDTIQGRSGFRFSYINIFSEPNIDKNVDYLRYEDIFTDHHGEVGVITPLASKIFHNRFEQIASKFINNYLSSYSESFLFDTGDLNARHGFGEHGLLYPIDIIFIFLGLFFAFRSKVSSYSWFFLILLLLAPFPFALTRDSASPHATRLIIMLPSLIFFSAFGFYQLSKNISGKFIKLKYLFPILLSISYLFFFFQFWHYYTHQYVQDSARDWHTGMNQAVLSALRNETKYQAIYFSNSYEPFLPFFLFYSRYLPPNPPITSHIIPANSSFFTGSSIDNKYYFGQIIWSNLLLNSSLMPRSLFVIPQREYNDITKYLSGQTKMIDQIHKNYINQEEFVLFSLN